MGLHGASRSATVPAEAENRSRGWCVGGGGGREHTRSPRRAGPGLKAESALPVFVQQTRSHGLCLTTARRFLRLQKCFLVTQFGDVAAFVILGTFCRRLLNNNQIKSIPGGAFEDLENLKYL